jgi:hypothetical protein
MIKVAKRRKYFMVTLKSVEKQLKHIRFNHAAWNHAEALELPNILMPAEVIYECVNGTYEGGFALLCATNVRLLLIDKKPFKFLTVEDLRFDMINQIDYSHRLFGSRISVSAGSKNLKFFSFNQQRLRKLIGHVQHCMAESKKEQSNNAESQQQHLEQINQQLQAYLLAQHQQQEELRKQLQAVNIGANRTHEQEVPTIEQFAPIKPSPQLSDYLFAQTLLKQYEVTNGKIPDQQAAPVPSPASASTVEAASQLPIQQRYAEPDEQETAVTPPLANLYAAGMQEIFGKTAQSDKAQPQMDIPTVSNPLEINPLRIAYSKLPMALRDRAFVRHATKMKRIVTPTPPVASTTQQPTNA